MDRATKGVEVTGPRTRFTSSGSSGVTSMTVTLRTCQRPTCPSKRRLSKVESNRIFRMAKVIELGRILFQRLELSSPPLLLPDAMGKGGVPTARSTHETTSLFTNISPKSGLETKGQTVVIQQLNHLVSACPFVASIRSMLGQVTHAFLSRSSERKGVGSNPQLLGRRCQFCCFPGHSASIETDVTPPT